MPPKKLTPPDQGIDYLIREIRGQKIILDSDLARIYGVSTKAFNQAVKRNLARFPQDFILRLSKGEAEAVQISRSQTVTLKRGQNVKYLPYAFTEHGALMAANVLNSSQAVKMSLYVIRAFVKSRDELAANSAIAKRLAQIDDTLFLHDSVLRDLYQKLRPLLAPPPEPEKSKIGFHSQNIKRG
jgi:ORF6N domain-containing protein